MRARKALATAVAWRVYCQASGATPASDVQTREELRRICQELIDAIAPGHAEVWRKYLDDRSSKTMNR